MNHLELGKYGEALAKNYLESIGYEILTCNYRFLKLELDIIAKKEDKLVVVEVKTRFTDEYGEPWQSVSKQKQRQIIKASNHYILENDIQINTQFDVISIVKNDTFERLEHIKDAFTP